MSKTYLVECFWPDARQAQVDQAASRLREAAARDDPVAFTGTIFIPGDEVVFYLFEGDSEDAVRATLARDPWSKTHLVVDSVDPWTIRLDGRT